MYFLLKLWACGTIVSGFCDANYLVYKGIKYSKEQKTEYTDLFEDTLCGFMTGMLFGLFLPFYLVVTVITFPGYIAEKIIK
jgi:hypothetical protein